MSAPRHATPYRDSVGDMRKQSYIFCKYKSIATPIFNILKRERVLKDFRDLKVIKDLKGTPYTTERTDTKKASAGRLEGIEPLIH